MTTKKMMEAGPAEIGGTFVQNMRELASDTARETAGQVKAAAGEMYGYGRKRVEEGMDGVKSYAERNPLQALALAVGAGFVIGYMLRSRRG